jgi:Signal transduction histidine kinase
VPSRKRRRVMEFLMDVPYISQVSVKSTYYIFHAYNSASHYICSMFLNRCTLTALLLAFLVPTVHAQQRPYSIVHYTTDHGLPQNSITGIAFDRWGYCWLGTEMGLVRFDGKSFTVFSTYNVPGLRAERIRLLVNCTDLQVCTDKNILSVILRNLIDNANKNTREGIIELTAQQQDGLLYISIIDTGKGMDNEAIASFFNKQAALSANGHGSLIVLNLLEKIGGKLSIVPKPDGGTIFRIALPNFVQGHVTKPVEPVR